MVEVMWLGGPQDGETVLIDDKRVHEQVIVLHGSKALPEKRYVTPRLDQYGKWILPFYEGTAAPKETR